MDTGEPLRVILGPTAAGKSALAMAIGRHRRVTIVSADSRHLYRGFDIGTAKPSAADRAEVPHVGLDVLEPTARWSAAAWAEAARGWCADARRQRRVPLVVGGTGFYVRALVQPLAPVPALDPRRRSRLAAWLEALPPDALARWCARLDAPRAAMGRTQRLRAVETALLAGVPLSRAFAQPAPAPAPVRYLVVDPGAALAGRIERRIDAMLAAGWLDEVRRLVPRVPPDAPAWQACGYGALREHVLGAVPLDRAVSRVRIETRQYAKRQRTWIRHQLSGAHVTPVDPDAPGALATALAWFDHSNTVAGPPPAHDDVEPA